MANISDILKEKGCTVYSVTPETLVYNALEKMSAHEIGAVLIMESNKLNGIFTERDYLKKIILHDHSSRTTTVGEVMTDNPACISPTQSVDTALVIMTKQHCRHLPVIDNNKIIGIVSIGDLVKKKISDLKGTIKYLNDYISG